MTDHDDDDPRDGGRFRKGRSGNLSGRPRKKVKPTQPSAFEIIQQRLVTGNASGSPVRFTIDEAIVRKTYEEATKGRAQSINTVFGWIEVREGKRIKTIRRQFPQFRTRNTAPGSVDAAMILLGIVREYPTIREHGGAYVALESWIINKSLARRSLRSLHENSIKEINACAIDASEILWPNRFAR